MKKNLKSFLKTQPEILAKSIYVILKPSGASGNVRDDNDFSQNMSYVF